MSDPFESNFILNKTTKQESFECFFSNDFMSFDFDKSNNNSFWNVLANNKNIAENSNFSIKKEELTEHFFQLPQNQHTQKTKLYFFVFLL